MKPKQTKHSAPFPKDASGPARLGKPARPHGTQRSGVALLIVLGMLVLLAVIVLAFITSVTTDLADSKAYEGQTSTRMLADSVVELITGEIDQASTATNQAWISQPGLLRTYDTNGNAVAAYKLYSANQMIVPGAFDPNAATDLPSGTNWLNQPNLWTDLNSPIVSGTTTSGSTNYVFPIIDGNGIQSIKLPTPGLTSGSSQFTYSTDGTAPTIEGFATNPSYVGITYSGSTYSGSEASNPVPMPVQWLYMLKDGSMISGSAASSTSKDVSFSNASVIPTGTNPIVARVAFWTDDESCKVNINTASEGTFWDTPVCNTQPNVSDAGDPDPTGKSVFDPNQIFEWDLAQRQPDRNEYQRYPGHPATTCLSPILGDTIYKGLGLQSGSSATGYASNYGYHTLSGTGWAAFCEFINQLAPRVSGSDAPATSGSDYSSRAGTYRAGGPSLYSSGTNLMMTGSSTYTSLGDYGLGQAITPDQDRLYATVDDYFFTGTYLGGSNGTSRFPNGYLITGSASPTVILTPSLLSKARFFLTADSKSPELNVFNMPRVCMWPITRTASTMANATSGTSTETAFDKVIAFCATVGGTSSVSGTGTPFYFTRYDAFSPTNDFMMSSGNAINNQNLYNYLQNLMGQPFPGLSANSSATFKGKYPSEDLGTVSGTSSGGNQILTEIYDYIRCTNLQDCSEDVAGTPPYGNKSYTYVNTAQEFFDQNWDSLTSGGQVVPIQIGATRGIGRIIIPGEMTLAMTKEDDRINSGSAENAQVTSIGVTSLNTTWQGTWNLSGSQQNNINVLLADKSPSLYSSPPRTPPTQDVLLLPGVGGFAVSSGTGNTYDPRKQTKLQLVLLPYYFSPMAGFSSMGNNVRLHWTNANFTVIAGGSTSYSAAPSKSGTFSSGTQGEDLYDSGRVELLTSAESKIGGPIGPKIGIDSGLATGIPTNVGPPSDSEPQVLEVMVNGTSAANGSFSGTSSNTMQISGSATLQIIAPAVPVPTTTWTTTRGVSSDGTNVIQTINFSWPQTTVQIPCLSNPGSANNGQWVDVQTGSSFSTNTNTGESESIVTGSNVKTKLSRLTPSTAYNSGYQNIIQTAGPQDVYRSLQLSGTMSSGQPIEGDFRLVAATGTVPVSWYQPSGTTYVASGTNIKPANAASNYTSMFTTGSTTPYYDKTQQYQFGWRTCIFYNNWNGAMPPGQLISSGSTGTVTSPYYADNRFSPYVPNGVFGVWNYLGEPGDWDNGPGWVVDGAYCNKPDEGWIRHYEAQQDFVTSSIAPFIGHGFCAEDGGLALPSFFAPNKMVSSPVMFGSLPTGVLAQHPWQTLLFRPAKYYLPGGTGSASGGTNHPGAGAGGNGGQSPGNNVIAYPPYKTLPDHALLDLFWMPVVDPYPISEPFATAGKVNLNYQIAPFTYITRKTALRAVLQSVKITALNPSSGDNITSGTYLTSVQVSPATFSETYKFPGSYGNFSDQTNGSFGIGAGGGLGVCVRRNIDLDDTLFQIDALRFGLPGGTGVNKPFVTASEICDVPLIPADLVTDGTVAPYNINTKIQQTTPGNYDSILAGFWYGGGGGQPTWGHRLTGDNSLERPYSMIYPRLTTKSNTYTVHLRVQMLKKSTSTPAAVFKDGQDQVTGEFRGSFVIERYLDPTEVGFYSGTTQESMSYAVANPTSVQLGPYRYRVISSKQFGQ